MAKQFKKTQSKVQKVVKKAAPVRKPSAQARAASSSAGTVAMPKGDFVAAVGRRKNGSARVRLYMQPGDYVVNEKPMAEYFNAVIHPEARFMAPFKITNTVGKYAVSVKVTGSGVSSQMDAVVLGIARALVKVDPDYKSALRAAGLMTRDPRMKETRKPNTGGKARRKRQSPKR